MKTTFRPRCKVMAQVVFDGRGGRDGHLNFELDPRSAQVGLNGHYEADTWSLTLNMRDLPFDPDQIASCHMVTYMWDDDDHLAPVFGPRIWGPQDSPDVVGTQIVRSDDWAVDANVISSGLMDDIESDMVGDDEIVKITGRDYTGLLIDAKWDPKNQIPSGKDLDAQVQEIADAAAPAGATGRFKVIVAPGLPIVKTNGLKRSSKKKGQWVKEGKSYWDVIWDLCMQHGFVPRVEGRFVVIDAPFVQTTGTLKTAPRLVYGKTLMGLSIKRKYQHEIVPQVIIRAWNPITNTPVEVAYPAQRNIITNRQDGFGVPFAVKKDDQVLFAAPPDIYDKETLLRLAKMRFYHLGRGETTYKLKTRDLWIDSPDQPGAEMNVMTMRPGQAIGISFDPFNKELLRSMEIGQRVDYIVSLGYKPQVANEVAVNVERMETFSQNYYYNRGDISYDADEGIEIDIEAVNFAYEPKVTFLADASEELP